MGYFETSLFFGGGFNTAEGNLKIVYNNTLESIKSLTGLFHVKFGGRH